MTLFRPVGMAELLLILDSDSTAFPPRLPGQPIFYPVLDLAYAKQIARDWNAKYTSEQVGYVTEFNVDATYLERFDEKVVGASNHRELWIPAEELVEFNSYIVSPIRVVVVFFGPGYEGPKATQGKLSGLPAKSQLAAFEDCLREERDQFKQLVIQNERVVKLNLPFWEQLDPATVGITQARKRKILEELRHCCAKVWPNDSLLSLKSGGAISQG